MDVGYLLRHALAILALPVTVTIVIPFWIARRSGVAPAWPATSLELLIAAAGVPVLAIGLLLFGASVYHFFTHGQGTLAPWDPPRRLVVRGPYRYVRNPMISGVIFILFAEAMMLRSVPHMIWACTFLVINAVYIPLLEEPMLEVRFGADYINYSRSVRRFIPRTRPFAEAERTDARASR